MPSSPDDPMQHVPAQDAVADKHPAHLRLKLRAALILVLCALAAVLLSIDSPSAGLHRLLAAAEPAIAAHPVSGPLLSLGVLGAVASGLAVHRLRQRLSSPVAR